MSNQSTLRKIDALTALRRSTQFEGEALAADKAIQRLEAKLGAAPSVPRVEILMKWQRTAWLLQLSGIKWSEREREFLESMRCKRSAPSERQKSWLLGLKAKADAYRSKGGWQ